MVNSVESNPRAWIEDIVSQWNQEGELSGLHFYQRADMGSMLLYLSEADKDTFGLALVARQALRFLAEQSRSRGELDLATKKILVHLIDQKCPALTPLAKGILTDFDRQVTLVLNDGSEETIPLTKLLFHTNTFTLESDDRLSAEDFSASAMRPILEFFRSENYIDFWDSLELFSLQERMTVVDAVLHYRVDELDPVRILNLGELDAINLEDFKRLLEMASRFSDSRKASIEWIALQAHVGTYEGLSPWVKRKGFEVSLCEEELEFLKTAGAVCHEFGLSIPIGVNKKGPELLKFLNEEPSAGLEMIWLGYLENETLEFLDDPDLEAQRPFGLEFRAQPNWEQLDSLEAKLEESMPIKYLHFGPRNLGRWSEGVTCFLDFLQEKELSLDYLCFDTHLLNREHERLQRLVKETELLKELELQGRFSVEYHRLWENFVEENSDLRTKLTWPHRSLRQTLED